MYVCIPLMLIPEIIIFCCPAGRQFPSNMILLFIFTIAEAYIVSFATSVVANERGGAIVVTAACMVLCNFLYKIYSYCCVFNDLCNPDTE
jgi:hypothetical protein